MNQHANETEQARPPAEEQHAPPAEGQEPSGKDVVLYTEGDVAERHGKLRQQISQLEKDVAAGKAVAEELGTVKQQLADRQRQDDEAETKRATEEGPEALDILSRRRALRGEAAESAKLKAEAEKEIAAAADIVQWRLDKDIAEVAKETGVSEEDIRLLGPITLEEVKKAADLVAKLKVVPATPSKAPDPGISSGGVSWRDKTAEEKILHAIEHPKK